MFKAGQYGSALGLSWAHPKLLGLCTNFDFNVCSISIGSYIKLFPPQLFLLPMPAKGLGTKLQISSLITIITPPLTLCHYFKLLKIQCLCMQIFCRTPKICAFDLKRPNHTRRLHMRTMHNKTLSRRL